MGKFWGRLLFGIALIVNSLLTIPNDSIFWGHQVPAVAMYVLLLFGCALVVFSTRDIIQGRKNSSRVKDPEYTDNDVLSGLKELEKQYVKQYGKLPDYHGSLKETMNEDKEKL